MISTLDNDIRVPLFSLTALYELLFQFTIFSRSLSTWVHFRVGEIEIGVLDYLPHKKEENDAIHRAPSLLGGEVVCLWSDV